MTLYLIIPCYNEELDLGRTLAELPQQVLGHRLNVVVVDDGSTDNSRSIAQSAGVELLAKEHSGYGKTVAAGLSFALSQGAQAIVLTDADAQYDPAALPRLLEPILSGKAHFTIAQRDAAFYRRMAPLRRFLHRLGALYVRFMTGLPLYDPVSGYRGFSRAFAQAMYNRAKHDNSLETLAQVALWKVPMVAFTWPSRPTPRPSRIIRNVLVYVWRQSTTLLWAMWVYRKPPAKWPP